MNASTVGNIGHTLNISCILIYVSIVFIFGQQRNDASSKMLGGVLDKRWEEEAHCRSRDATIAQSHLDSAVATTLIFFLFVIYFLKGKKKTSVSKLSISNAADMEIVDNYMMYALLAVPHAFAHFLIYTGLMLGVYPNGEMRGIDDLRESSITMILSKSLPVFVVWSFLLKSYMQSSGWLIILIIASSTVSGFLYIPFKFGLTFVLCILFFGHSLDQLFFIRREKKTFAYAIYPYVMVLPIFVLSILECTQCSSSVYWAAHGHVIIDAFMALSYPIFYAFCSIYYGRSRMPNIKND
mmetsp:Transcript_19939/g.30805  ORF Transcript_19939/g.30805 Transcript_19939/m.30805 type:complete len:296 (-) Transcript_19939:1650-2537(-)